MHTSVVGPDADPATRPTRPTGTLTLERPDTPPGADGAAYRPRHGQAVTSPVHGLTVPRPAREVGPACDGPLARALHLVLLTAARGVEARTALEPDLDARIRVSSPTALEPLVVRDDGVGLTGAQVRGLLSASVSGADVTAAESSSAQPSGLDAMIRACLRVAELVEIRARSAEHPEAATLRAVIRADGTVRLSLAGSTLTEPGTEVRLHVLEDHRSAVRGEALPALVAGAADQLRVPVEVDGAPVEGGGPLFDLDADAQADWCRERLGVDPLAVLPLGDGVCGTRAVAFVLPTRPEGEPAPPQVMAGGLRIADGPPDLVPEWAGFCVVVLDAGRLPLRTEGDALAPGPALADVRTGLARGILAQLILLEAYDPERFRRLTEVHEDAFVAAAVEHADVMDTVRSTLLVPTSLGPVSLEDFRVMDGDVACAGPDTWPVVGPAAARDGVLVVDARRPGVLRLLDTLGTDGPAVVVLRPADVTAVGTGGAPA
ncbi:HSP90 family protein [Phycicoccus flavus]|uniref:Uncharacterized protein n=1 Tax=Phycicoccus flavus TaxID=2502783 RepID=A0A8T6R8L1_9MICO|nr:hypothetical protein [Phycicoccus flavus]NHA70044.1 hypothetical protein [Phycicoccus flavus]